MLDDQRAAASSKGANSNAGATSFEGATRGTSTTQRPAIEKTVNNTAGASAKTAGKMPNISRCGTNRGHQPTITKHEVENISGVKSSGATISAHKILARVGTAATHQRGSATRVHSSNGARNGDRTTTQQTSTAANDKTGGMIGERRPSGNVSLDA